MVIKLVPLYLQKYLIMATISQQIKKALDGRSQRWLAMECKIPETNLSKKLAGKDGYKFTQKDLAKINKRLKTSITI